jgi:hypothetical protein
MTSAGVVASTASVMKMGDTGRTARGAADSTR